MAVVGLIRLVAFATVIGFALICLGIGANFAALAAGSFIGSSVGGLAVAIAIITVLLVPAVIIIDYIRKGAIITAVWCELIWVGILSILWIAVAGHATAQLFGLSLNCDAFGFFSDADASLCRQYQALQAFSWLNWLILFFWFWFLLVAALIAMTRRGNKGVWSGSAKDIFSGANNKGIPPIGHTATPVGGYPPQQPYGAAPYQQPQMTGHGAYPPGTPVAAPYQTPQHTGYAPPGGQPYGAAQV